MTKSASITFSELIEALPESTPAELRRQVEEAYRFVAGSYGGQRRASGESYLQHSLAVALTIARLGINDHTIVAALLHDALGDQQALTVEELFSRFGQRTGSLLLSCDNLRTYVAERNHKEVAQQSDAGKLEKIRRAILAMIEQDVRVILLELADNLQELRKAAALPPPVRQELALAARQIYAPLASRLGVWQLKWELEDLAFRYLEPEQYQWIAQQLDARRAQRAQRIEKAAAKLRACIEEIGLKATVTGRPKHIYSIYRKMQRKGVSVDQIYDIHALRVILHDDNASANGKNRRKRDEEAHRLCYDVVYAVHSLWQPIPQEFDDYIAAPKPNGYKSLHTAVMDENGETLEVQIRTEEMDKEAELGIAAHWAYKEDGGAVTAQDVKRIHWFRQLLQTLRETNDPSADSELLQQEFLDERIYVFTPRGDVIDLPAGSTPIDFAYQIHTEVGHRCRGAKVNTKMVSLDYQLQSGDRVQIITANRGGPSRDWMNENLGYTRSARTRSKIRSWFREQEREKNIEQGRVTVERELRRLGLADVYSVADIATALRYEDVDQFLAKVGFGDIQSTQIGGAIATLQQKLKPDDELRPLLGRPQSRPSPGLTVRGMGGLATKFAGCCNPIPPEPIKGYITRGQGITVHAAACKTLLNINERERLIDVEWGSEDETYPIPIVVRGYHRPDLVEDITNVLKGRKISAPRTKKTTANSVTTIYMVAEVADLAQLEWLLDRLDKVPNVFDVQRQRWA